jgi:hypothetical protein
MTFEDWPTLIQLAQQKKGLLLCPQYFKSDDPNIASIKVPKTIIPDVSFYLVYFEHLKDYVKSSFN